MSANAVWFLFSLWCIASVPLGVFLGKWIAGPKEDQ